jgi:hypothetical protein
MLKALIKRKQDTGLWTFNYLGSTLDAVQIARSMNFKSENSEYFKKDQIMSTLNDSNAKFSQYLSIKQSKQTK